jgi:hypothetical protein
MFQKYIINLSVFPKNAPNHNVMPTVTVAHTTKGNGSN